jgi:hypothetical protein
MRLLADPNLRLDRDPEQVGFDLSYLHAASRLGKLVERRPVLPTRRHPLALVGADRADPARLRVLDAARLADPHGSAGSLSGTKHRRRL